MERNRGSGMWSLLRPPAPHLARNHSPILQCESFARKKRPYLLKIPQITEEEPEFPSQNISRCSKPTSEWGSHCDQRSEDRGGVCWVEEGNSNVSEMTFFNTAFPLLSAVGSFSSNIRGEMHHHVQPDPYQDSQDWKKSQGPFVFSRRPTKTKFWLLSQRGPTLFPHPLLNLGASLPQPSLHKIFMHLLYSLMSD